MKNINKKLICVSAGVTCIAVGYKYYSINFSNTFILGGAVPIWFILLILLVPVSPLVGKVLKKSSEVTSDTEELGELISNLKGEIDG